MISERAGDTDTVYSHKPSLMGPPSEFRLAPDAIEWSAGRHRGRIAYARIGRVRLSFRPVTMQTRRFVAEIWPTDGPRLSLLEQQRQDREYGDFIRELHRRIAAAGGAASFETGTPAVLYWPGLAV